VRLIFIFFSVFSFLLLFSRPGAHEGELAQLFRGFVEFFSESYRTVFRIPEPPLHDPLAVCFVLAEELFGKRLVNVEVETGSFFCFGQTVADLDCVSGRAPNVWLVESVDASAFWRLMLAACRAAVDHVGSTI
jgi:inosine-uridine nucleoside N-ribohydrolase